MCSAFYGLSIFFDIQTSKSVYKWTSNYGHLYVNHCSLHDDDDDADDDDDYEW